MVGNITSTLLTKKANSDITVTDAIMAHYTLKLATQRKVLVRFVLYTVDIIATNAVKFNQHRNVKLLLEGDEGRHTEWTKEMDSFQHVYPGQINEKWCDMFWLRH